MTKILKSLTVFILVISLVLTYIPVNASNIEDEALFQTEAFGIFEPEADGTIDWNKEITRAEFAHAISVVINNKSDVVSYELHDVNVTTPYKQEIYTMMLLGIMNGDGNGHFRPEDFVSGTEAAIVFLRLLGYGPVINGADYIAKTTEWSSKTGILKGVDLSDGFQRRDFARMLYNALDVKLMDVYYMSDGDTKYYISDTTFREIVFTDGEDSGAYYGKGIVLQTAMAFVDVPYTSIKNDEVVIGSTIYKIGNTNAYEFFGMEVQFFAQKNEDGVYELISISPTQKNNVVRLDPDEFLEYSHESYIKYNKDDKEKKISLDNETALIKNFDTVAVPSDALFTFDCGELIVIDNDNDASADVILIYSYENAVVSGVYDSVVTLKDGFAIGGTRYLNLKAESKDLLFSVVDSEGLAVDINSLSSESVISVAADRTGKILRIVTVQEAKVTGRLNSIYNGKFEIDGKAYNVVYDAPYNLGETYDCYVNFKGDIVYYEVSDSAAASKYAYVIGVDGGGFSGSQIKLVISKQVDFGVEVNEEDADNVTQVPMLICQNQEIVIYELADKVRYNGTRVAENDLDSAMSGGDNIVEYKLNADGEVAELSTPDFKAGSTHTTYTYSVYDKCFGGAGTTLEGFALNEKTQLLCIPQNAVTSDEDYLVKSVINVAGNTIGYYVRGYDYNEKTKKCGLVVINREMRSDNIPAVTVDSSKVAIVEESSIVVMDDEEVRTRIKFIVGTENKTMFLAKAVQDSVPSLKEGDLFVYEENYDGEIANLKKIRSAADLNVDFNQSSSLASGASETYGSLKDIQYDEVDNIYTRLVMNFVLDVNGTEITKKVPQRNKPTIYIYETNGRVYSGGVEDIVPGTDKIYLFMKNASTTSVVLVIK